MNVVVSGSSGVLGRGIVRYFENSGYSVCKTDIVKSADTFQLDFNNKEKIENFICSTDFDFWINCIGSYSNIFEKDINTNLIITQNILESIFKCKPEKRIILIGSSAEYGIPKDEKISEDHPLNPINFYGLTKTMQYSLFDYYFRIKNLNIVLVRIFNLLDNKLPPSLLIGKIYAQISEMNSDNRKKLELGYLESSRDYIKTVDVAKQLEIVALHGKSGQVYNSGMGYPVKIRKIVEEILASEGYDYTNFSDIVDYLKEKNLHEVDSIYADMSKFSALEPLQNKEKK